jgi:hypothetical protein
MKQDNKIYALSQSFMNTLYDDWTEQFYDQSISDFLGYLKAKYTFLNSESIVKGDTGIFFNPEIIESLNNENQNKRKYFEHDFKSSELIYYGDNKCPGLYRIDENGSKIPLDFLTATDPRIWNYLSLFVLNQYTVNRWGESKDGKRIFLSRISNEKISRHSIARLYWSGGLCSVQNRTESIKLLRVLWSSEDFMTQVTERSTSDNKIQLQWFLEFCNKPENINRIFNLRSSDGYPIYRSLLKLFIADDLIYNFGIMEKNQFNEICFINLESCLKL